MLSPRYCVIGLTILACCVSAADIGLAQTRPQSTAGLSAAEARAFRASYAVLLIDSAAARSLRERLSVAQQQRFRERAALERRLAAALRAKVASDANRSAMAAELSRVRGELARDIERAAQSAPELGRRLEALQRGLAVLEKSDDPAIDGALSDYADGKRVALEELQRAVRLRRSKLSIEDAVGEQIAVARVWADGRDKGLRTIGDVVAAWREAEGINKKAFDPTLALASILNESGDLTSAGAYARRAQSLASSPEQSSRALLSLAQVQHNQGSRAQAAASYASAIQLTRRLIAASPRRDELKVDLAMMLSQIGRLEIENGQLDAAKFHFSEEVSIYRALYASHPTDLIIKSGLQNSLEDLGYWSMKTKNHQLALELYKESLQTARSVYDANPALKNRVSMAVALIRYGEVAETIRDWASAEASYAEALQIDRAALASDPSNEAYNRSTSVSLHKVGRIAKRQGNMSLAIGSFQEAVVIIEATLRRNPTSAALMRSLLVDYANLAQLPGQGAYWAKAYGIATQMDRRGVLANEDRWMLAATQRSAAAR